jgi:DNA-binding transcriptional ArsR family regulator
MTDHVAVCEALGDATRRDILEQLRHRPRSVAELAAALPVSRPAVSQHLKVLHEAGLVTFRAEGTRNVYRLDPRGLDPLKLWLDTVWDDALEAFAEHARKDG